MYYDDFFFYGDLAFAVIFTCHGISQMPILQAFSLQFCHLKGFQTDCQLGSSPMSSKGGDDDPTVLPWTDLFPICIELAGLFGRV